MGVLSRDLSSFSCFQSLIEETLERFRHGVQEFSTDSVPARKGESEGALPREPKFHFLLIRRSPGEDGQWNKCGMLNRLLEETLFDASACAVLSLKPQNESPLLCLSRKTPFRHHKVSESCSYPDFIPQSASRTAVNRCKRLFCETIAFSVSRFEKRAKRAGWLMALTCVCRTCC